MTEFDKVYIHLKTGNEYKVLKTVVNATNAQSGERMVLYARDLGLDDNPWYVRSLTEFNEKFKVKES